MMQDQTIIPYRISVYTARLAGVVVFLFLFSLSLSMVPNACLGNWLSDTFIDPADGHLDMSKWLLEQDGFMPVPILITEPAIGYGGGLALVYFHETIGARQGIHTKCFCLCRCSNRKWNLVCRRGAQGHMEK